MQNIKFRFETISGVPQGDHLSPLVFDSFINDTVFALNYSYILLFADNANIFKLIKNLKNAESSQVDLNNIYDWCTSNGGTTSFSKKTLSNNI